MCWLHKWVVKEKEILPSMIEQGAGKRIDSESELASAILHWIEDRGSRKRAGERAAEIVGSGRGATGRTIDILRPLFQPQPAR